MMSSAKHPVTLRRISYWIIWKLPENQMKSQGFWPFRFESCMWWTLGRIRKLAEITSQIAPVPNSITPSRGVPLLHAGVCNPKHDRTCYGETTSHHMFASKQAHVRMIPMYHQVTSFRIHLEPTELEFEPAKTASSIQRLSYQNEKKTFYFGRFRSLHLGVYRICVHKMLESISQHISLL